MVRELIWLENFTFAAWGCSTCAWIFPNPGETVSGKPPKKVQEAFDQHECAKFPRIARPADHTEAIWIASVPTDWRFEAYFCEDAR